MPRPQKEKCRLCSKLSVAEAQAKHGPQGDNCWNAKVCHRRRNYYRHRDSVNPQRRRSRQVQQQALLDIPALEVPAAVLHLYRTRVGDPLPAVGAELGVGGRKIAAIEPVHTLGMAGSQVKGDLRKMLEAFSLQQGVVLERFEAHVELDSSACPISPCPLRP